MSEIGKKLISAIRAAAEERPDYVYPRAKGQPGFEYCGMCMYVLDSQPSCIVGRGAWDVGLINAEFEHHQDNESDVSGLLDGLALELDEFERYWLSEAQEQQDNGEPWGAAVALADDHFGPCEES